MKKTLLVGINAKFIHSNLALRYIKKYYAKNEGNDPLELLEYSINQEIDYILNEIIIREPEIVTFSCYLWNIEMVRKLSKTIKTINANITIIYGGPEVSYTGIVEMTNYPFIDYIIQGEGEEIFRQLFNYLNAKSMLPLTGIVYREEDIVKVKPPSVGLNMDEIPFPYDEQLEGLENRILYYETSRGCPFHCQYCLSSIEAGVRFKSFYIVSKELDFFLNKNVRQVKLVDRTFNTQKEHAIAIMNYIIENDNGITNFHFEVAPELMSPEFISCLQKAREGLFQLEIGVQSTNEETLDIIQRENHLPKIQEAVESVKKLANTHMHLDLIAGLPKEDYKSFGISFDYVYRLKPEQLQLGFLKVLKGSGMMGMKEQYGVIYRGYPPYEVLKTKDVSYLELARLKMIEEMVELFYNSGRFLMSISKIVDSFDSPFIGFEYIADYWLELNMHHRKHQKLDLYEFIYKTLIRLEETMNEPSRLSLSKIIMFDYCLNEKPKKTLEWMNYSFVNASLMQLLLDSLSDAGIWIEESQLYTTKQRSRMFHIDEINKKDLPDYFNQCREIVVESNLYQGSFLLVNYLRRDFLHNNGEAVIVTVKKL